MSRSGDIPALQRTSWISRPLRAVLRPVVLRWTDPAYREVFAEQFPEAARNVELALEGLLKIAVTHPIRVAPILQTVGNYLSTYFGAQRETSQGQHYLIYTREDHRIPFRPEWDTFYAYMLGQISSLSHTALAISRFGQVRRIARLFRALNEEGASVFHALTTRMPRLVEHSRLSLSVVQRLDAPVNCCPSLHVAYTVAIDNLFERVLAMPQRDPTVWQDVRAASLGMLSSVLYTKQHSLIDVAFGILVARRAFTRQFPGHGFNDLVGLFDVMQETNPDVPYERIAALYREADRVHRERRGDLLETVRRVFRQQGYPLVDAEEADAAYAELMRSWDAGSTA